MGIRDRLATLLFPDLIHSNGHADTAAVSVRVDDSRGWDSLSQPGPADRPWAERQDDLDDALEAWRKNFLIRRIVNLTHSYVVGSGITISSQRKTIDRWIEAFWTHTKNHMDERLAPMCDELTRSGELFVILFTNKVDGMSYIRFLPATSIRELETDPDDYETELRYGQITAGGQTKWWISPNHPDALKATEGTIPPVMLHLAVNRPIGATRGEGDLGPVLPWAKRYSEWLSDRVRLNRIRTRQGILDITLADDSTVQQKRQQLRTSNPVEAGIYVHGPGEEVNMHSLNIRGDAAEDDGKALRLSVATGSGLALHYLGEGESTNYATAKEMGEPTTRFFTDRQTSFTSFLHDIITTAYTRYLAITNRKPPADGDLHLTTTVGEVARADNESLAKAASSIVGALVQLREQGWIDDPTAIRLAFKFAGEQLRDDEVEELLKVEPRHLPTTQQQQPGGGKNNAKD